MSAILSPPGLDLPGHLDLPSTDGRIVENSCEQFQNAVLTSSIEPLLRERHPDGQYFIGQDVGIYFSNVKPPLNGCKAPDWFYVPNVTPQAADGIMRHSYVMWRELTAPSIIVEQVSGDGSEERDETPNTGKFWVYEKLLKVPYYVIGDGFADKLECFQLSRGKYVPIEADAEGRFHIPLLNVSIGLWSGVCHNHDWRWLRFYDADGQMLLTGEERAERESERAERESDRAERESERANREKRNALREKKAAERERDRADSATSENALLRAQLAKLGIEPKLPPSS